MDPIEVVKSLFHRHTYLNELLVRLKTMHNHLLINIVITFCEKFDNSGCCVVYEAGMKCILLPEPQSFP